MTFFNKLSFMNLKKVRSGGPQPPGPGRDTRGIQIHIARGRAPTNAGRRAAQPLACTRARRSTTTETNAAIDRNVRALRTTTTITNIF